MPNSKLSIKSIKAWWQKFELWNALVIGSATVALAICAVLQSCILNNQLAEARLEQRPWVYPQLYVGNVLWDQEGIHVPIKYVFQNSGHNPAMHVVIQSELQTDFTPNPQEHPHDRINLISKRLRSNSAIGFPIFPSSNDVIEKTEFFPRDKIDLYLKHMNTYRGVGETNPSIIPVTRIPISLIYVIDYRYPEGEEHHQTLCTYTVNTIDPNDPQTRSLALPIDKNLTANVVRLIGSPLDCSAD